VIMLAEGKPALCSGVLIAEDLVLTAAHCVPAPGSEKVEVLYDLDPSKSTPDNYRDRNAKRIFSTNFVRHETYRERGSDIFDIPAGTDLALIRLDPPLAGHATANLPRAGIPLPEEGIMVVLAGWGAASSAGEYGLNRGPARMTPSFMAFGLGIHRGQAEYGNDGGSTICPGDSGGPAFWTEGSAEPVVVGIHSYRIGYCPNAKAKATYIPEFVDWIKEKAALLRGRKDL